MAFNYTETKIPTNGSNRVVLVKEFLDEHYDIKINIFDYSKVIIISKTKVYPEEISIEDISLHMLEDGICGSDTILKKIITSPNQTKPYNPIKEYFESLVNKYAGISHIEILCSYLKARDYGDKPAGYYQNRLVYTFRKWIVATVACAMGVKGNDAMFVVVNNEEGIGKSRLMEFMAPEPLQGYFAKSEKDMNFAKMFTSYLMINFDEIVGITKTTAEEFKNILSSKIISVSKQFTTSKQRYASAMGTSNKDAEHGGFLTPEMGTRRFAINHIDAIDWKNYNRVVNIDQIWAEAVMLIDQDFEYTWNPDDFREFAEYNSRFIVQTSSFKILKEFYRVPEQGEEDIAVFRQPVEILRDLRSAHKVNTSMTTVTEVNIGIALKQLGYSRFGKKINNSTRYGYLVIPLF